jgi:type IV pilus assembly protein PilY1
MLTKFYHYPSVLLALCALVFLPALPSQALDTDAYQVDVKQNAYILLDNSGSMDFGVYENSIDYGAMYDALFQNDMIGDTIVGGNGWFENHYPRTKIYLVKGKNYDSSGNSIGVSIINIDGKTEVFTGDAADPEFLWYSGYMIDTHTYIDQHGNLTGEDGQVQRITTDDAGYVLLDGVQLPLGQNILLKDFKTLYDGSQINEGFGGLLNAPGYYFSALEEVGNNAAGHNQVEHGDTSIYFFITGNWMNMQQMYNLHYTSNPPGAPATGDPAWKYELFTTEAAAWNLTSTNLDYPEGNVKYDNNLSEMETRQLIRHVGAKKIQLHFDFFEVEADKNPATFNYDYVAIYDQNNNLIAKYDDDNSPEGEWTPVIEGDTAIITLRTDGSVTKKGYIIDEYRATFEETAEGSGAYKMQNRLDVAKESMLYVVDEFRGKINWGFASFAYNGTTANGATFGPFLNPTVNDDVNRQAIVTQLENTQPKYGTPLGEALQDVFEDGYYGKRNSLDNLLCRRNYAIVVSDGFPSGDNDWSRIGGVTFRDFDNDNFTSDPYQPPVYPNYYDDVAHWIYTHSWLDKTEIDDPVNSYENIIPHQIAFGAKHPLMRNAAEESGAEYITAYNKSQLVNAFYSLGLMMTQALSFTAPAVSVDAENKIQNGEELYMGLFIPRDASPWVGNLKKFQFGDGSALRPEFWGIYDADNNLATDLNGDYLNNTVGFWGDENDANDTDTNDGADIMEDGVGEVLTERVVTNFSGDQYERKIKYALNGALSDFTRDNVTPTMLELDAADTDTRNKIVNWTYGYTFDADASGNPTGVRDWALGPIIHSRPVIIDYYNSSNSTVVEHRYIAIGAGDGMLHIFDDETGEELIAIIPDDALRQLKNFETLLSQQLVDGEITIVRQKSAAEGGISEPKYLIFTQRRGGSSVVAIDIENSDPNQWTLAWVFDDSEMEQSWSALQTARIKTGENAASGEAEYTAVGILTGGYDPIEDNYPEPFTDSNNNGLVDNNEWSKNDSDQDLNGNNQYDTHNPDGNNNGRALYVIDLTNGQLLYSMKHCPEGGTEVTQGTQQTSKLFKYCFPASPSVVVGDEDGTASVLKAIYAIDVYGNLFRFNYDYDKGESAWSMQHIFSVNPGSLSPSGTMAGGDDDDDPWRKVFYAPSVSWRGSGYFFDTTNYRYPDVEFENGRKIATLFFGTGDREHPLYNLTHDRIYAVYDDSVVTAESTETNNAIQVTSVPYSENDLLNITCDELGTHTEKAGANAEQTAAYKTSLNTLLMDDVVNSGVGTAPMEFASGGDGEDDSKGWYIILDQQAADNYCDHCQYQATIENTNVSDRDNHFGEKIISRLTLYAGVLYFSSYQRSFDDPCAPNGNSLTYALNYLNGSAALNLNTENDTRENPDDPDSPTVEQKDVTDRYRKTIGIKALPSALQPVTRKGETYIPGFGKITDRDRPIYFWIER